MAGGTGLAVLMFWPLALHLRRDIPKDLSDSLLEAQILAWNGEALLHRPLDWWQWNVLWPNADGLAFSDALIGYAPIAALGSGVGPALWHYNAVFLLAYGLAFAGAYLLARELGVRRSASVVAGVAFAYSPWRSDQSAHLNIISSGGIPLSLMLLTGGYRRNRPGAIVAGWLVAAWQVLIGVSLGLQLVYLLAILAAIRAAVWWHAGRARPSARVVCATAAGVVALGVVCVVVARPYLGLTEAHPEARRTLGSVAGFSPPPQGFLAAPADNFVWGRITRGVRDTLPAPAEQSLFPGALAFGLALLGTFGAAWPRRLRFGLATAAIVAGVLSLGLEFFGGRVTYRPLFEHAPGWSGPRTPGRLHTLTTLALALLAGAGAGAFAQNLGRRRRGWLRANGAALACTGLALVVLLEGSAHRLRPGSPGGIAGTIQPTVPRPPPGLRQARPPLLHLPMDDPADPRDDYLSHRYTFWSVEDFPQIVNGVSGSIPRSIYEFRARADGFPDARAVRELRAAGVRTVVLHPELAPGTPWAAAGSRSTAGLGVRRRAVGAVVLFDLGSRRSSRRGWVLPRSALALGGHRAGTGHSALHPR